MKRTNIKGEVIIHGKQKARLVQKLDAMTFEKRLCHVDFHPFNLIMSNKDVAIIDWIDFSAGDIRSAVCQRKRYFNGLQL